MPGVLLNATYESGRGTFHKVRVHNSTTALVVNGVTNEVPAAPAGGTVAPRCKVSGGKSQMGLTARRVGLRWKGDPPTGFAPYSRIYVAWLKASTFPNVADGSVATYQGKTVEFIGTSAEQSH